MKIFRSKQIKEIDSFTIENEPIHSINLMERAALSLLNWIETNFDNSHIIKIFAGPGNNGGDALALARLLDEKNYRVTLYIVKIGNTISSDFKINHERLKKNNNVIIKFYTEKDEFPVLKPSDIVIDGLFGSGLSRPLDGFSALIVNNINRSGATVIAIDIPSGLFGEDNSKNNKENIIRAKHTLSFQFPKLAFFFPENYLYVGNWVVLPIGLDSEIINKVETPYYFLTKEFIVSKLKKRSPFAHKGSFGHALLIAGSYGKMGAAILASKACIRSGSGLVTVHIPENGYQILQIANPEIMLSIDKSEKYISTIPELEHYDALGIGPGLGRDKLTQKAVENLLSIITIPLVIDADGLNILSENPSLLSKIPAGSILTPHPKEFERLAGKTNDDFSRNQLQRDFAKKYNIYLILKGAYTSITCPDGNCYFNTTGNSGMATAGSGDVLTGIILSLLGQGYSSFDASIIGVYLHGIAGDFAKKLHGEESLIAGDIIENIGNAYNSLKSIQN